VSHAAAAPPFRPAWWAPSGLLQTLVGMRAADAAVPFVTLTVPTPDDDDVRVHVAEPDAPAGGATPLVLLLHGLEGSRGSAYVRATARHARRRGFGLAVLEFRTCGGEPNRARRTYHSGETGDLDLVVATLAARWPQRPLLPLGFSLGANVLLKWLGERGDALPAAVRAAAAVSPPFDLAACADRCDRAYRGAIARHFLRTLVPKALAKERQFAGCCDPARVRACRTLRAFDDAFTAPLHGFRDAAHYYATQSCGPLLPAIRRPTLLIAAADDPLVPATAVPRAAIDASPFLHADLPAHGGHVAFVDGGTPWRPHRWAEERALAFLAGLALPQLAAALPGALS
jgi:predicted alpha/beta-fold hydrolase